MRDLLRRRYREVEQAMPPKNIVLEEVAPSTGFAGGWADALVLGAWPSKGFQLDGFEIKASKADLKRELADLGKHRQLARYCDTWTLLAWDGAVLDVPGIPAEWGIMRVGVDADGDHKIVLDKKPARLTPEPWPRAFVASMVRNAHQQGEAPEHVVRALHVHERKIKRDADLLSRDKQRAILEPLITALHPGKARWLWSADDTDPEKVVRLAVERLATASQTALTA